MILTSKIPQGQQGRKTSMIKRNVSERGTGIGAYECSFGPSEETLKEGSSFCSSQTWSASLPHRWVSRDFSLPTGSGWSPASSNNPHCFPISKIWADVREFMYNISLVMRESSTKPSDLIFLDLNRALHFAGVVPVFVSLVRLVMAY